ncbi:protein asteroid [Condylostylus longicornis]|uniref:protein asteroid n=1 Tax=Condylostylus longicornis TaxID=2530218 RepID=UPI00244DD137|nr:protein asteroid [Condylostylus longicornis]
MGVKGLTSFIAKNAEQYMKPFELHDCDLVIDGDNLACNLYKDVSECNSAFGGDYDKYYRTVIKFFQLLSQCNIRSFVLLDGGYEQKKMRTVQSRLRAKIACIKHINPSNSRPMFPLMMREVFVDAVKNSGVHLMRCMYEADEELAALARCLNCPVLSYDSDFYVFNVKYIPLITLRMKVLEKKESKMNQRHELRACEAKNLKKKQRINSGQLIEHEDNIKIKKTKAKTVKYLDCCLYKIENLLEKGKLDKEKLPLFAALLGNDYINVKMFKSFYSQVGMKGVSKKIPKHQKRVMVILKWLRYESKQSAMEKILGRMKKDQREILLKQMQDATNGYLNEKCTSFKYFNLSENDRKLDSSDSEDSFESEDEESIGKEEEKEGRHKIFLVESDSFSENEDALETSEQNDSDNDSVLEMVDKNIGEEILSIQNTNLTSEIEDNRENRENSKSIPDGLLIKIYSAAFPRFVNDLLNLKLYINNPQVENFLYPDCNEIAVKILLKIFAYLHYPETPDLRYLTRVVRLTNCIYKKFSIVDIKLNRENMLEELFETSKIDLVNLLKDLQSFPADIRYYIIVLIYWANNSKYCDKFHIHAILICLIILRFIDTKIEPIRDEKQFLKLHGKKIQKEKMLRNKNENISDNLNGENNTKILKTKDILNKLQIYERINYIPKTEIILLQQNFLKYFVFHEDHRKSHTIFSSIIVHGFSEFQAVIYQMYTLNALLDMPFEQIKMSNLYSGLFLYNIYTNLQQRLDIQYYVKNFMFQNSETVFEYYQTLCQLCETYIAIFELSSDTANNQIKKSNKKLRQKLNKNSTLKNQDCTSYREDMISDAGSKSNEEDINLANNKFGLLSIQ